MRRIVILQLLLLISIYSHAKGFSDSMVLKQYRQFHFNYSNDLYHGTDRYLTQLAYFKYITPWKDSRQKEFILQQNVYTPSDIFGDTVQRNDRPYTSLFSIGYGETKGIEETNLLVNFRFDAGFLGKHALGEQTQRDIHYAVNSRQALGWKYQLSSAPSINVKVGLDKGIIVRKHFEYILHEQVNTGTVFNDVSVAQTIRVHIRNSFFPYLNNSGLKTTRLALSMKNEFKYVLYNGTLQGGIGSRHNIYSLSQDNISPFVYYQQIGLHIAYQRLGITYSESFISKEFKTGLTHKWSSILFYYLF